MVLASSSIRASTTDNNRPPPNQSIFSVFILTLVVQVVTTYCIPFESTEFYSNENQISFSTMSNFLSQIMQPGGGMMLLPFVRIIVTLLLVLTLAGFLAGVARIHMAVLAFLSAGLLVSLSMFESEYNKVRSYRGSGEGTAPSKTTSVKASKSEPAKTD